MKLIVKLALIAAAVGAAPLASGQESQRAAVPPVESASLPTADPAAAPTSAMGQPSDPGTRIAAIVPAGMTPEAACSGLMSLARCSAALHASQNLNIRFADVKDKLANGASLVKAIHALKPQVNARKEVERAEQQAREDLRSTG